MTLARELPSLVDWKVDKSFNGSDHSTITFSFQNNEPAESFSRNYKKAEWDKFTDYLKGAKYYYPSRINRKKIDKMITCLNKRINDALNLACPLRK